MPGRIRSHLTYANVVATICLFLLLGGGTALAAVIVNSNADVAKDTISGHAPPTGDHSNIISGSVSTQDLKNEDVRSADVRDFSRPGGGLTGDDIADGSVDGGKITDDSIGATQLSLTRTLKAADFAVNDPVGGGPTDADLIETDFGYQLIGRCDEPTAGTVKASILVKTAGSAAQTMAVDSTAQGGVNDFVNVPDGTEETLVTLGPTTGTHIATGGYGVTSFLSVEGNPVRGMSGDVTAATKSGLDCRFGATAQN